MLIIIEGADLVGKSTFVRRLTEAVANLFPGEGIDVFHRGPPRLHPLDEYVVPLVGYRPGTRRHVICDRWHLGELVYPRVFGRSTVLDDAVHRHTELFLRSRGAVQVLLDLPLNVLRDRYALRGDNLVTFGQVEEAWVGFRRESLRSRVPTLRFWSYPDVGRVIRTADSLDRAARTLAPFTTYVGASSAQVLLLGDRRHRYDAPDPRPESRHGPAFMPYPATSGHWLLNALPATLANRCGVANACDVDDPAELARTIGATVVVPLGRNAQRAAARAGIAVGGVPHPQNWRRFHHRHAAEYGDLVAACVADYSVIDRVSYRPGDLAKEKT